MADPEAHPAVLPLLVALAGHDRVTTQHSLRVAHLADLVASDLGLPAEQCALAYNAGLLHDVGKLAIDRAILNKIDALEDDERVALRRHCITGAEMLAGPRWRSRGSRHRHRL